MVWWRRQKVAVPSYPLDARVPAFAMWPRDGIVGQIGRGPDTGGWVIVDPIWDPTTGILTTYVLELPRDLFDDDGEHLLDDPCVDAPRADGEGGLIDYLTTALDVEWSLDPAVIEATRARKRLGQQSL
jgi:hypothetical protein